MQTKLAVITEIDTEYEQNKIWMQLNCDTPFPIHHTFTANYLSDFTRIQEIQRFIKADNVQDFVEKQVRVIIEQEGICFKTIAIGSSTKNKFIDLYGDEFPVSEHRIFRRYDLAKKRRVFINALKAKWKTLREHIEL